MPKRSSKGSAQEANEPQELGIKLQHNNAGYLEHSMCPALGDKADSLKSDHRNWGGSSEKQSAGRPKISALG